MFSRLRRRMCSAGGEAEAGAEFTVTVHGRPVAHLGPPREKPTRRTNVDAPTLARILASTPTDIAAMREAEAEPREPWTE